MSDTPRYVQRPQKNDLQLFNKGIARLPAVLRQMGYQSLRKGQDSVVHGLLMGRDSLCVLPTATGKTACYVVPTLALEWKTLVFSPLIALMHDQVRGMRDMGVRAGCLMSGEDALNQQYLRLWARGELDVLLVAPVQGGHQASTA
jgi:ATP-dependent DNA helicase RecQ